MQPTIVATPGARLAREALLAPLTDGPLTIRAARCLSAAIKFAIFEIDERLPPETELAECLGISVVTLRTALAVLRDVGCVSTRRGRDGGTFVAEPKMMPVELLPTAGESTPEDLRDLLSYGVAITRRGAELAAARATSNDIGELRSAAERVAVATDPTELLNGEAAFHIRVASCSQSLRFTRAEVDLQLELGALIEGAGRCIHGIGDDPRAIVSAIAARDGELAASLRESHLRLRIGRLIEYSKAVRRGVELGSSYR
jgi:DNA-binding FadR family transcriptional regulator